MDIRTFEAFSMKDAVKALKKDLGPEAVILSTKEKPSPSGKGLIYEVTAASSHSGKLSTIDTALGQKVEAALLKRLDSLDAKIAYLGELLPTKRQMQLTESGIVELKTLLLETLRNKEGSVLENIRVDLVSIERQLRAMGIDDLYNVECLKYLQSLPTFDQSTGVESVNANRDNAIRWMMKKIKIAPRWITASGAKSAHIITGPSGVGKTSLVAKLAAFYHKVEHVRVCVVSLDQKRLAAAEQMRVFCKIVGVPFYPVSSVDEFVRLLDHDSGDLYIIDTEGLSPKDQNSIKDVGAYKSCDIPVYFHLCLSITEKEVFLESIIRSFSQLGLSSLSFTKLDEANTFGEIFNLARRWSLPLGYFTLGTIIPDDLERATRERVVERIFGL